MMSTLWLRNVIELAARASKAAERQPDRDVGDALDLGFLPTEVRPQGSERDVAKVPFICLHVTGVRGGYGVGRQLRRRWARRHDDGTVLLPADAADLLQECDDPPRMLGLWDRYRRTIEYHRLVSNAGQQYRVHPLEVRTPHAGPDGNDGVGFAVDQHPREHCPRARATNAIDLLLETADEIVDAGHPGPVPLTAHRCVAPPSRRANDPGPVVWRAVVLPALQAEPGLVAVDYEFCRGRGLPIPRSWDPGALYDARGNRLQGAA